MRKTFPPTPWTECDRELLARHRIALPPERRDYWEACGLMVVLVSVVGGLYLLSKVFALVGQ